MVIAQVVKREGAGRPRKDPHGSKQSKAFVQGFLKNDDNEDANANDDMGYAKEEVNATACVPDQPERCTLPVVEDARTMHFRGRSRTTTIPASTTAAATKVGFAAFLLRSSLLVDGSFDAAIGMLPFESNEVAPLLFLSTSSSSSDSFFSMSAFFTLMTPMDTNSLMRDGPQDGRWALSQNGNYKSRWKDSPLVEDLGKVASNAICFTQQTFAFSKVKTNDKNHVVKSLLGVVVSCSFLPKHQR